MSENQSETGKSPETNASAPADAKDTVAATPVAAPASPVNATPETAAKAPVDAVVPPAAPKAEAPAKPEPPPIPAGVFGAQLEKAGIPVIHLGPDAMGNEVIRFLAGDLVRAAEFLRDTCYFDLLLSCSAVDWKDRLESVYHLYSTTKHTYLAFKVDAVDAHSPSLTPTWEAADWHEREGYDLMGIHYDGHPNLVRILMPDDWLGHPLRKDYKMEDPRLVWNER